MVKDIIITNRCQVLTSRGMCTGPVHTPFKEDVSYIFGMVCDQYACIHEVLRDGSTVELNIFNYDKDNQPAIEEKVEEEVRPYNPALVQETKSSKPVEEKIDELNTPIIEEVEEKVEQVETIEEEKEVVSETINEESVSLMDGEDAGEDSTPQQRQQNKQNHYYKKNKNKNK